MSSMDTKFLIWRQKVVEPDIIKSWGNLYYWDFTNCTQLSSLFQRNTGLVKKNVIKSFFALVALVKKVELVHILPFLMMQRLWFYWNYHVTKTEMVNISQSIPQQHTFFSKENVNLAAVSMFASIWKKKIAKTSTTIFCFPKWKIVPSFLQDVQTFYFGLLSLQSTMSFWVWTPYISSQITHNERK